MPRGRIWPRGWGSLESETLLTLMPTWVRLTARALNLLPESFPCSTVELLPEWEATLGLPDECTGVLPTIQQRTAAVCCKFAARGGQSREYFIRVAKSLGYDIAIDTFKPFYAGQGRAGDPGYGEAWAFAWRVTVDGAATVTYFRAGNSAAGEPLADWGHDILQCFLTQYAPAETILIFAFSQPTLRGASRHVPNR
jgi:uncharacterized protein YmfQ (DUF2313 family)